MDAKLFDSRLRAQLCDGSYNIDWSPTVQHSAAMRKTPCCHFPPSFKKNMEADKGVLQRIVFPTDAPVHFHDCWKINLKTLEK